MLQLCRFFDKLSALARIAPDVLTPESVLPYSPSDTTRRSSGTAVTPVTIKPESQSWEAVYEHGDLFKHAPISTTLDITLVHLLLASSSRGQAIDAEVLIAIVKAACKAMWYMPNIRQASTKAASRITVVGMIEFIICTWCNSILMTAQVTCMGF